MKEIILDQEKFKQLIDFINDNTTYRIGSNLIYLINETFLEKEN